MDEHELARVVAEYARLCEAAPFVGSAWRDVANALAKQLRPAVEPLALAAGQKAGLCGADADDFVADAILELVIPRSHAALPRICMWDPALGEFEMWARRVLRNLALDAGRRAQRRSRLTGSLEGYDLPQPTGRESPVRLQAFLDDAFTAEDVERMAGWGARDRLELTLLSGFWVKFLPAPDVWKGVQREYESDRGVALPAPFPPLAFLTAETPGERATRLAPALGYASPDALLGRWYRALRRVPEPLLRTLSGVADLEPER